LLWFIDVFEINVHYVGRTREFKILLFKIYKCPFNSIDVHPCKTYLNFFEHFLNLYIFLNLINFDFYDVHVYLINYVVIPTMKLFILYQYLIILSFYLCCFFFHLIVIFLLVFWFEVGEGTNPKSLVKELFYKCLSLMIRRWKM
jgi:hypothetical protein